ncbi:hypothetical protein RclHR1_13780001 [Rhizophagus clarus]|nr:hypothetical protein RclHR1_13780001 [Rhizophagus clarus]
MNCIKDEEILTDELKQISFFNYFKYIRHLHCANFFESVQQWCKKYKTLNTKTYVDVLELLFTQFTIYSPRLLTLDLRIVIMFDNEYLKLENFILSNPKVSNWISQTKELYLEPDLIDDLKFFKIFDFCINVSKIECSLSREQFKCHELYKKRIIKFLSLQSNLEHLCFYRSDITTNINETLMKHRNSLRHLEFDDVDFKDNFFVPSFYNLKTLSFYVSSNLENVLIPLIHTPLKSLNTLIFSGNSIRFEILSELIESINRNLEVIDYHEFSYQLQDGFEVILKKLSNHCLNLKELSITISLIGSKEISLLNCLLTKCTQLKYLELLDDDRKEIKINSILLLLVVSPTSELKINGKKINNIISK